MNDRTNTPDMTTDELSRLNWRESSFSDGTGTCVSVARVNNDTIAMRNNNRLEDGAVLLERRAFAALCDAIRARQLDHVT